MDTETRAELLRQRFRAIGGMPFTASGKPRKPQPVAQPKPARICLQWPEANRDTSRAGVWMHKPDPKRKVLPSVKNNAGESAITRISRKANAKKLSRAYRTAEALLAER